jgi:beta,beta-carotene 9',10'-dioxygenase
MEHTFRLGYQSLNEETVLDQLPVRGHLPSWLRGTLLRNGPAKFEVGEDQFRHWFDGFAMLHRFSFQDGKVSYANKFLQSDVYKTSIEEGRITFSMFASDPCKSIFKGSITASVNANVSINKIAGEFAAMTETPLPIAFNPETLDTLGVIYFEDDLKGHHGCAHPHYDFAQQATISYMTEFFMPSQFRVFGLPRGAKKRYEIGSYPVMEPAYIHSFGMTENYVVIAEFPYRVNPLEVLNSGKPFIENYKWRPEEGAQFIVMRKRDGSIVGRYHTEAFFTFHHVNAFEQGEEVLVDLSAYPDPGNINALYLDHLRSFGLGSEVDKNGSGELRRYHIPLRGESASYEVLTPHPLELPTINYHQYNTHDYGVAYGVSINKEQPDVFTNRLLRVDLKERTAHIWEESGCYPGEPVFTPTPDARAEDDGVILSVILNAHKGNSFLLVLDAHTFEEIARAEVPHHIPYGFHGQFYTRLA